MAVSARPAVAVHEARPGTSGSRIMSTKVSISGYCMTAIWSQGPVCPIRTCSTSL